MITIQLSPEREELLRNLARSRGEDASNLARSVLEEYLDHGAPADTNALWADASVALASEVLDQESWDDVK